MEPSATTDRGLSGHESVKQEAQQSSSLGERTVEIIHCEKEDYELMLDITRKMAEEILRQTGLEIAFAQGEAVRKDFSLGRGNFGVFRVGYAKKGGHYVGIKVTQGDEAAEAEIKIQASLSGFAHIMPSVDYCKVVKEGQKNTLYQIMPLAGLGSVAKIGIAIGELEDEVFKEQIVFCLAEAVLTGLSAMHNKGFYHLDNKPDNIVVNQNGEIFLIDFGCSVQSSNGFIDGENQIGDNNFFSPERFVAFNTNEADINRQLQADKIDIWAVGLTLVSVLTKERFPQPISLCQQLLQQTASMSGTARIKSFSCALEMELQKKFSSLKNPQQGSIWSFIKALLNIDPEKRPNQMKHWPYLGLKKRRKVRCSGRKRHWIVLVKWCRHCKEKTALKL